MEIEHNKIDVNVLKDTIYGLTEQIDLLTILQGLSRKIVSEFDFDQIISNFLDIVKEVVNYNTCAVFLYDEKIGTYNIVSVRGASIEEFNLSIPNNKIVDWIMNKGSWTPIPDESKTPGNEFQTILPLQGMKKKLGFLLMTSDQDIDYYNNANITILSFIADQTGIALENQNPMLW